MIKTLRPIVQYSHDVRVVVLVVIVKGVEKYSEAAPLIARTEDRAFSTSLLSVPEAQTVRPNSAASGYSEDQLNFPP